MSRTMARPSTGPTHAAIPCSTRAAISAPIDGASAHTHRGAQIKAEPGEEGRAPAERSESGPNTSWQTAKPSEKAGEGEVDPVRRRHQVVDDRRHRRNVDRRGDLPECHQRRQQRADDQGAARPHPPAGTRRGDAGSFPGLQTDRGRGGGSGCRGKAPESGATRLRNARPGHIRARFRRSSTRRALVQGGGSRCHDLRHRLSRHRPGAGPDRPVRHSLVCAGLPRRAAARLVVRAVARRHRRGWCRPRRSTTS